jgi:hypothetical protein
MTVLADEMVLLKYVTYISKGRYEYAINGNNMMKKTTQAAAVIFLLNMKHKGARKIGYNLKWKPSAIANPNKKAFCLFCAYKARVQSNKIMQLICPYRLF